VRPALFTANLRTLWDTFAARWSAGAVQSDADHTTRLRSPWTGDVNRCRNRLALLGHIATMRSFGPKSGS